MWIAHANKIFDLDKITLLEHKCTNITCYNNHEIVVDLTFGSEEQALRVFESLKYFIWDRDKIGANLNHEPQI